MLVEERVKVCNVGVPGVRKNDGTKNRAPKATQSGFWGASAESLIFASFWRIRSARYITRPPVGGLNSNAYIIMHTIWSQTLAAKQCLHNASLSPTTSTTPCAPCASSLHQFIATRVTHPSTRHRKTMRSQSHGAQSSLFALSLALLYAQRQSLIEKRYALVLSQLARYFVAVWCVRSRHLPLYTSAHCCSADFAVFRFCVTKILELFLIREIRTFPLKNFYALLNGFAIELAKFFELRHCKTSLKPHQQEAGS